MSIQMLMRDPTMIRAMTQIVEEKLLPRLAQCSGTRMMLEIHDWCRDMDAEAHKLEEFITEEHFLAGCSNLAAKE